MITLSKIETVTAEKNFAKKILKKTEYEERYKTIFLNGAWGTGKTEYLSRTEKNLNKGKFICLKFWEQTDERSAITIAFAKIHPILYWLLKFFTVFAVIISILMTPVINLGLGNLFDDWWAKLFGLIALFVAIWQFFKYKSDNFYSYFLKKLPTKFLKQKVLILDDFDRIKNEKQEKLYQLFNIIKGQMPIIFVGDFKKISNSEGAYLRKIIDERVDLPISINPINIWEGYFSQLSMTLNVELSQTFKQLFIEEARNLRDRTQFNMLVNQEFFERNKKGRVQVEQQLVIIYISWFYPELLQELREGRKIIRSKNYENFYSSIKDAYSGKIKILSLYEGKKTINDIIDSLLDDNNKYPKCFEKNREAYFLYESISNLSIEEAEKILNDDETLEKELSKSSINYDFLLYLQSNYNELTNDKKIVLLELSLKKIKKYLRNPLINFIIQEKHKTILIQGVDTLDETHKMKEWDEVLGKNDFDISEKLYFFKKYLSSGFRSLGQFYPNLSLESGDYTNAIRKDFYFLTYLSQNNIFYKFKDWKEQLWETLDYLTVEQYLSVLTATGLINNSLESDFELIPKDKKYIVYKVQYSRDRDKIFEKQDNTGIIKKNIKLKLDKLKNEGYRFEYLEEECY